MAAALAETLSIGCSCFMVSTVGGAGGGDAARGCLGGAVGGGSGTSAVGGSTWTCDCIVKGGAVVLSAAA